MSDRYGKDSDPIAATLRRLMTVIEQAADTLQVHLASERTQGVNEALEVIKVLKLVEIESLA